MRNYECLQGGSGAPHKPGLPRKAVTGIVALCGGILPLSLFPETSNSCSCLRFNTYCGIAPLKLLCESNKVINPIKFPSDFRIDPPDPLCDRIRMTMEDNDSSSPMFSSRGPLNSCRKDQWNCSVHVDRRNVLKIWFSALLKTCWSEDQDPLRGRDS
ncbi:hypothetical protein ACH5RR_011825 [Cinchona calisaya]|uniref:Uncharacterized protein n=1 Tax=Cinchona calisaya TaxID=153742 RepID=A0ABD3A641_9GENT